jgi:hypothetical protein
MSKSQYFMKQCVLRKSYMAGYHVTTSWIPEKFAIKGTYVKLKGDDGWLIESVGDRRISAEECNRKSQEHKKIPTYGTK